MPDTEESVDLSVFGQDVDAALNSILPNDCLYKGSMGMAILANQMVDAFLAEKGWARDCFGAMALFTGIAAGDWKVPWNIHDAICGCRGSRRGHQHPSNGYRNLTSAMNAMTHLINQWRLPQQSSPGHEGEFTYYAHPSGTKKQPLVYLRVFRGEPQLEGWSHSNLVGFASYCTWESNPQWNLYLLEGEGTSTRSRKFGETTTPEDALSQILQNLA